MFGGFLHRLHSPRVPTNGSMIRPRAGKLIHTSTPSNMPAKGVRRCRIEIRSDPKSSIVHSTVLTNKRVNFGQGLDFLIKAFAREIEEKARKVKEETRNIEEK